MKERVSNALRNIKWSAAAQIADKALRFFSVPMLLAAYGREDYGLIAIIFAINGYLGMLTLGTPGGLIKHVAEWLQQKNLLVLERCARTTLSFYSIVGAVNASVFLLLAGWGVSLFHVSANQGVVLTHLFLIAAGFSLVTWPAQLIGQLLAGAEEIHFVQRCNCIRSAAEFVWVLVVVHWTLPLDLYFGVKVTLSLVTLPFLLGRWARYGSLSRLLRWGWHWAEFRPVIGYGLNMLLITFWHTSFMELRCVLLGTRAESIGAVTDFAVLAALVGALFMARSWVLDPLIPSASKALAAGDQAYLDLVVFRATRLNWCLLALPTAWLMACSGPALQLYAGNEFRALGPWLSLLACTAAEAYLAPVAAVIFAAGRLRPFLWSNLLFSLLGLAVVWFGSGSWGARSAVVATCLYYGCQFTYHHVYYLPKVMQIDSGRLLRTAFLGPAAVGVVTAAIVAGTGYVIPWDASWIHLGTSVALAAAVHLPLCYALVLSADERKMISKRLCGGWIPA